MRHLLGNIEEFISLIQERPVLYNFTLNAFNDKNLTQKLWEEIACKFDTNVDYCKTKWGTLRVSFARQMRNEEASAKDGTPLNDWYLKDNMAFMRDYMRKRKKRKSNKKYIENNYNSDTLSKSTTIAIKTDTILSNSSLEIKNEPIFLDENESLASLDICSNEDFIEDNRITSDVVSIASSSVSNREGHSIDNYQVKETFDKYPAAKSRKRRKAPDQESQIRRTHRLRKPSWKRKENEANDPLLLASSRNEKEQSDTINTSQHKTVNREATMSFFKSILPDFNRLTERRQRLVKQKLMESLNNFLDEQEDES